MEMYLNDEQAKRFREFAGLLFSPLEISIMLQLDHNEVKKQIRIEGSQIYNLYFGGRLEQEVKFRKKVIAIAEAGSSPAQTLVKKLLDESAGKIHER